MNRQPPSDQWVDCPPGTLDAFQHSNDFQRRKFLGVAGGGALVLLVSSVAAGYLMGEPEDADKSSYSCREVRDMVVKFTGKKLNAHQLSLIHAHLNHCPPCEHFYRDKGASV